MLAMNQYLCTIAEISEDTCTRFAIASSPAHNINATGQVFAMVVSPSVVVLKYWFTASIIPYLSASPFPVYSATAHTVYLTSTFTCTSCTYSQAFHLGWWKAWGHGWRGGTFPFTFNQKTYSNYRSMTYN